MKRGPVFASCVALVLLAVGCHATWSTQPSSSSGGGTAKEGAAEANRREVTGRVASYTTAPRGEMDGLMLDTGNRVHFPVHTGSALLPLIGQGQVIRVVGSMSDRPEGKVIEVLSITNVDSGKTITVASVVPPKAPPPPSEAVPPPTAGRGKAGTTTLTGAELTQKEGKVTGYTTAPTGDMDGVLLDSGSRVHFPARAGTALLPLLQQGKTIRVIGWEVSGPEGVILEATKITGTPNGKTVDIDEVAAPRPPAVTPGAVAPPGQPPLGSTSAPPATRVR